MKKLPLKNTETKNIPIGPQVQKVLEKVPRQGAIPTKKTRPEVKNEDLPCPLAKPTTFTLNKLKNDIEKAKLEKPDINEMLQNKMASPNTAKYVRKKKASKVNVAESTKLYKDLVSLDISGNNLIAGVEEDLRKRACTVQPPKRPLDPLPSLCDYFTQDEFLNTRKVGPSNIFPLPTSISPSRVDRRKLSSYTEVILGN